MLVYQRVYVILSYMRVIPVPARQRLTTIHEMNLQAIKRNIRNSGFTCPSWTCLPCATKKDLHQANSIGRTAGPCLRRWQPGSPATWRTTRVRLAKPREHFGEAPTIPAPPVDESPKPGQIDVPSSKELHTQPSSCMSASPHRLHKQSPFAKHDLGFDVGKQEQDWKYTDDWRLQESKVHAKISEMESCIVRHCSTRKLLHSHRCEEVLCDYILRTLEYMTMLHPMVKCCIVRYRSVRKLQHCHHCEEVLCDQILRTLEYMTILHPMVKCCIVRYRSVRKLQHCHHCEEILCDDCL